MSSTPNRFNSYGDDAKNHPGFVPMQMTHNVNTSMSTFLTSNHTTNHGVLFSSSPSLTSYQNSHFSSSSFGFNRSHMNYQMRRNIASDLVMRSTAQASSVLNCVPLRDNPPFTQISFTQTITNRYSAIVPTNTISNLQNDIECFNQVTDSRTNIWNSIIRPPNFLDRQREILNPESLNSVFPHQNSSYPQGLNMFSSFSNRNHDPNVPQDGQISKGIPKKTKHIEKTIGYSDAEEDDKSEGDHYDGRTHSLPYEKYGPYTCPTCDGVFDTSQKFAAHMSSHYKSETKQERMKRFRARNKRKYQKLKDEVHHNSPKIIKLEDGDKTGGINHAEALQVPVIVKEECA